MGGFSMYKFSHGQIFSFLLGVYLGVELLGHMVTHFPRSSVGKESACNADSWVRKIPWRRKRQPTPVVLPGESHGQRSLAGYSPWGCKSWTRLSNERERMVNSPGDLPAPGIKPMSLASPVLFLPGKFQGQRSLVGYM